MQTPFERSLGPAGWAVYLGSSWTWCIGMFLPALLIRDLGFWGFVVFAVPNVIGAGAMGWVLRSPETSRKLVEDHKAAAVMFSQVTILFHIFWICWIGWVGSALISSGGISSEAYWGVFAAITIGSYIMATFLNKSSDYRKHVVSFVVWCISAGLLVSLAMNPDAISSDVSTVLESIQFSADVVWLMPASVFGFLFCPYLDLTFNHARQSCRTPKESRFAFGMGFGVFFFSMIVLTFIYGTKLLGDITSAAIWAALYLVVHVFVQLVLTVLFHSDELERANPSPKSAFRVSWFLAFAIAAALLGLSSNTVFEFYGPFGLTAGEFGYRLFLTFYALIFPAYVWLNIFDVRKRSLRRRTAQSMRVTIAAIVLASPFFFMGFIMFQEIYILPGMAIVLLAKLFTGRDDKPAPIAQPA